MLKPLCADKRHVAGQNKNPITRRGGNGRFDSAQRAASRVLIVAQDSDREPRNEGPMNGPSKQTAPRKLHPGFVLFHPTAAPPCEYASLDRKRDLVRRDLNLRTTKKTRTPHLNWTLWDWPPPQTA